MYRIVVFLDFKKYFKNFLNKKKLETRWLNVTDEIRLKDKYLKVQNMNTSGLWSERWM